MNICCCSGSELLGRTDGTIPTKTESNSKRYGRSRVYTQLYTYKVWFPKRPFRAEKQLYGNQISRGMVEGECIHIGNLIPKTALSSQKAALRESNFLCVYILLLPYLLKFDSRKAAFWLEMAVLGIKFPMCIHLLKFDSRKASFWLKRAVLGIKFPMCIHSPSTIPLEIWFP